MAPQRAAEAGEYHHYPWQHPEEGLVQPRKPQTEQWSYRVCFIAKVSQSLMAGRESAVSKHVNK